MDWFVYDRDPRHKRAKGLKKIIRTVSWASQIELPTKITLPKNLEATP